MKQALKQMPPERAYRLLEPGPIVLVTTADKKGCTNIMTPNIMTMGFHMMVNHDPPLIACIIGPWDFSYQALKRTKECVIAVPTVDLAKKVVDIGNCSGEEVEKFKLFGLTPRKARKVKAPLIAECLHNIECRVEDTRLVSKYGLFILKAVAITTDAGRKERRTLHHNGNGTFNVDGRLIDLSARMVKFPEVVD